jgi:alpha-glucosidase
MNACHVSVGSKSVTRSDAQGKRDRLEWWQRGVIYEIAPISFFDSNGDGKGDLRGLIERIDYIEWLGVDAIWLTPIYPSPMLDFGYDVSDFSSIAPCYGSFDDFHELVEGLRERNVHVLLDFVANHTSDQHPWFLESRSSRTSSKRSWFVWADAAPNGGPPNNWVSRFGGSAWEWEQKTGQYYYHAFLAAQPDLNWRNPDVRNAMSEVLRFWMRRGVDGFRVDASAVLTQDELLRDDPVNPQANENTPPPERLKRIFTDDRPETMPYLEELRRTVEEFPGCVLAGEVQGETDRIGHFYGDKHPRLHIPLNFALLDSRWDALSLQAHIDAYVNAIPKDAWPNWAIGGHDKHRVASKIGQSQARILAMLLMTMKGTPIFFAGDELGMEQIHISADRVCDPFEKRVPGFGLNRDPERSPMRWDASRNGGFTTGAPWLPMGDDIEERNVERLQQDKRSLLWLYHRLIQLRRTEPALTAGDYVPRRSLNDVLTYKRTFDGVEILVGLNIQNEPRRFEWQGMGALLLSTHLDRGQGQTAGPTLLRAGEGVVIKLQR